MKFASDYDLVKMAKRLGISEGVVWTSDRMYAYPDLDYIQGEFSEAFYQRIKDIKLKNNRFDCNKVAVSCLAHLSECWARKKMESDLDETALAAAMFCYLKLDLNGNPIEGHACIAIAQPTEDGVGKLVTLEPQIQFGKCLCDLKLSKEEFSGCHWLAYL